MRLNDEQMSAKERDEAHEILSEMRDHVGAIDNESEVRSFQTFQKTLTSGEFITSFKANAARNKITSENFKTFSADLAKDPEVAEIAKYIQDNYPQYENEVWKMKQDN